MCNETPKSKDGGNDVKKIDISKGQPTTKEQFAVLDEHGGPIVQLPPNPKVKFSKIFRFFIMYTWGAVLAPIAISVLALKKRTLGVFSQFYKLYLIVTEADNSPIDNQKYYQDPTLLAQLWKLPSARHYLSQSTLEYQIQEGYCSIATLRCILKSFKSVPNDMLPVNKYSPSTPEELCEKLEKEISNYKKQHGNNRVPIIQTKIVRATNDENDDNNDTMSSSYQGLLNELRRGLNNPNSRVAINYLRPALFGFKKPKWVPIHIVFGVFAGHFSPIIGIIDREDDAGNNDPLVAIFDVNHKYGGVYFVPFNKLYNSIHAKDIATGKSRSIIILEEKEKSI